MPLHSNLFYNTLLATLIALLTACQKGEKPADHAAKAGILRVGNGAEPQSLDPHKTCGLPENDIMRALFEGLVWLDPATFKPLPGVAQHWDIAPDGLTYTFFLRHNAKWSNGDPVTAHDFAFAFKRALLPETGALIAPSFFDIHNAEAFNQGRITDFSIVGINALEDYTLQLTLCRPSPYLLSSLANSRFAPLHEATLSQHGLNWIRPEFLISNGPFKMKAWAVNEVVSLEKNPYYWDQANVRLNGIDFLPISGRQTEEKAFLAGQLHKTLCLPPQRVQNYTQKHSPLLRCDPLFSMEYVLCNTQRPPLNDKRVRQALSLSINRDDLVSIFGPMRKARTTFIPPEFGNYQSPIQIKENIEQARRLLTEAGYPNGEGFPTLHLIFNSDETHQQTFQILQAFWKAHLGINIELENKEWKAYLADGENRDFNLMRRGWLSESLDPSSFLDLFYGGSPNNNCGWKNQDYDMLFINAQNIADLTERNRLYGEAEAILMEEIPAIPILSSAYYYLLDARVKGVIDNGMHYFLWHHFFFEL